jgi:hypothetical protein
MFRDAIGLKGENMRLVQLITILIYAVIAWWYVAPWLRRRPLTQALTALLWVHVFRYAVLYIYVAQHEGYPISPVATEELVIGDLTGALLAIASIVALRFKWRLGLVLSWLVVAESVLDFLGATYFRISEPARADATGVWWVIFVYFGPLILVSLPLMAWQLYTRGKEYAFDTSEIPQPGSN